MFQEITKNLQLQCSKEEWNNLSTKRFHLGIFTEPYLSYILNGQKRIESRFSKNKIAPYNQITKEDIVWMKQSGGSVLGYFTIKEVLFFDLTITPIEEIKRKYQKEIMVSEEFWQKKQDSNYATLIFIDKITLLTPFKISKIGMQSWIVLKK